MNRRPSILPLLAVLLLCACSGPPQTSGQNGPSAETDPESRRASAITRYETFDASKYRARPPAETEEINHRVPARLMRGRADEGVTKRVQGYRIQVFSASDKSAAQNFRQGVVEWWKQNRDEAPGGVFEKNPPIVIMYSQPYYRVRIGTFVERDSAEKGLAFVRSEYSNAFIARSTVTATQ